MPRKKAVIAIEQIASRIIEVRGQRAMLDEDLARLYGVETRTLVQAVKRNADRFPKDFLFSLTRQELTNLKSQIVISSSWGGRRRSLPYAFTEHGAVMLANVLHSRSAIDMSVHVVRAFIRTRQMVMAQAQLAEELQKLKRGLRAKFSEYDEQFRVVFEAIDRLINPPEPKRHKIGFHRRDQ
jgi:hypothetical protein